MRTFKEFLEETGIVGGISDYEQEVKAIQRANTLDELLALSKKFASNKYDEKISKILTDAVRSKTKEMFGNISKTIKEEVEQGLDSELPIEDISKDKFINKQQVSDITKITDEQKKQDLKDAKSLAKFFASSQSGRRDGQISYKFEYGEDVRKQYAVVLKSTFVGNTPFIVKDIFCFVINGKVYPTNNKLQTVSKTVLGIPLEIFKRKIGYTEVK